LLIAVEQNWLPKIMEQKITNDEMAARFALLLKRMGFTRNLAFWPTTGESAAGSPERVLAC
jgi:hypothetical protein